MCFSLSAIEAAKKLQEESAKLNGFMVELPCLNHQTELALGDACEKCEVIP